MGQLADIIRGEICKQGAVSFARFMELCLYCPVYGYYEAEGDKIGRRGDYYTSVSVGSLFGELLARQFQDWATQPRTSTQGAIELVEAGAHTGALANDILQYLKRTMNNRFAQISYTIVEPSERRRAWQELSLAGFKTQVHWVRELESLAPSNPPNLERFRVVFCNELLDALPVHRVGWDAAQKVWFEWGVSAPDRHGHFGWTKLPLKQANLKASLDRLIGLAVRHKNGSRRELEAILPDGYTVELSPAAELWWTQAAASMGDGKLMTIDYGIGTEGLFPAERKAGTLRAYRGHHASSEVLANPGEQDLTAHVNFGVLEEIGHSSGLRTEQFTTQERFLTATVARSSRSQGEWNPERAKQFRTLTHPDHLGSKFRVLVQSRTP